VLDDKGAPVAAALVTFLEDEVQRLGPGVEFVPDHDQRFVAGGGVTWEHARSHAALSVTARYETGTPIAQDEDGAALEEQPGAETVDFESGRVRPRTVVSLRATVPFVAINDTRVSASVQVLNLLDDRYAYNFGNPFSGTHFGAPRTVAVSFRVTFR
jgi:outer membrane receptor for Fe3+-dicitrate